MWYHYYHYQHPAVSNAYLRDLSEAVHFLPEFLEVTVQYHLFLRIIISFLLKHFLSSCLAFFLQLRCPVFALIWFVYNFYISTKVYLLLFLLSKYTLLAICQHRPQVFSIYYRIQNFLFVLNRLHLSFTKIYHLPLPYSLCCYVYLIFYFRLQHFKTLSYLAHGYTHLIKY